MRSNNFFPLAVCFFFISGMACKIKTSVNVPIEAARAAIAASNAIYFQSFVTNDVAIFINCYAEDACIMAPFAETACGRENAGKFFRAAYDNYGLRNGKFVTRAVYGMGDEYVAEEGLWESINTQGKIFDNGKFLVVWKHTKSGWKMFRDSFSSDHKPQADPQVTH